MTLIKRIKFNKWVYFLLKCDGKTSVTKISNEITTTYTHCIDMGAKLEDLGYIESSKRGRWKFFERTVKGEEIALKFVEIMQIDHNLLQY